MSKDDIDRVIRRIDILEENLMKSLALIADMKRERDDKKELWERAYVRINTYFSDPTYLPITAFQAHQLVKEPVSVSEVQNKLEEWVGAGRLSSMFNLGRVIFGPVPSSSTN